MHHRHHEELQGVLAETQGLAFGYHLLVLDRTIESLQWSKGLCVANDLYLRPFADDGCNATAMVGLVMINNKVVDLAALQCVFHLEKVFLDEPSFNGVNQGNLFVHNEI